MRRYLILYTIVFALAFGFAPMVLAVPWTFTTIDVPGVSVTHAFGINNAGQIVGAFKDSGGSFHGFLKDGPTFTSKYSVNP